MKQLITIPRLNFVLVTILLTLVGFSLFAPIVPAEYDKPVVQNSDQIYAGQVMKYKIHTCRYVGEGVITDVTRQLVSTTNKSLNPINLSTDTVANEPGCRDTTKSIIIPYSTPPGTYQLVVKGVYSIVPIRQPITVTATSDSFNIKAPNNTPLEAALRAIAEGTSPNGYPVEGSSSTSPDNYSVTPNSNPSNDNPSRENPSTSAGGNPPSEGLVPGLLRALGGDVIKPSF